MKNFWILLSLCAFLFFNAAAENPPPFSSTSDVDLRTEASPIDTNVDRIGINLGQWTQYGSAFFAI